MLSLCTPGSSVNLSGFGIPICKMHFQTVQSVLRYVQKNSHCTNAGWRVNNAPSFGMFDIKTNFSEYLRAASRSSQWLKEEEKKKKLSNGKRKRTAPYCTWTLSVCTLPLWGMNTLRTGQATSILPAQTFAHTHTHTNFDPRHLG